MSASLISNLSGICALCISIRIATALSGRLIPIYQALQFFLLVLTAIAVFFLCFRTLGWKQRDVGRSQNGGRTYRAARPDPERGCCRLAESHLCCTLPGCRAASRVVQNSWLRILRFLCTILNMGTCRLSGWSTGGMVLTIRSAQRARKWHSRVACLHTKSTKSKHNPLTTTKVLLNHSPFSNWR